MSSAASEGGVGGGSGNGSGVAVAVAAAAGPVPKAARFVAMDVIRGVALFGILVVNALFFGYTLPMALYDSTLPNLGFGERFMAFSVEWLFVGKFISTFSFLFGAGLWYQMQRMDDAARRGAARSWWGVALRRLFLLGCVGFFHAIAIWYGDVLFYYDVLGTLLIPARLLSTKVVAIIGASLLALSVLCMSGAVATQQFFMAKGAATVDVPGMFGSGGQYPNTRLGILTASSHFDPSLDAMLDSLGDLQFDVLRDEYRPIETAVMLRGPIESVVTLRALLWAMGASQLFIIYLPHTVGLFLLGSAAARTGLFAPSRIALQRTVGLVCLPLGLPFAAVLPATLRMEDPPVLLWAVAGGASEIGAFLMCFGLMGTIAWLVHRRPSGPGPIATIIGSGGRMAFTIYLSMSVIMTFIMYGWGLGYFGQLDRIQLFGLAVVVWTVLVLAAHLWLSVFRMGPLEWLWRAGTYLTIPPLRRGADDRDRES
jgi:uncharacterized protein